MTFEEKIKALLYVFEVDDQKRRVGLKDLGIK